MAETRAKEEAIFHAALELDSADQRSGYLDAACGDEAELRRRVEALLRRYAEAEGPLDRPAIKQAATSEELLTERPGTRIGPYKLLQQIGEGGMGIVFMAEQHEPIRRKVALKIIKPGMDSQQVVARFEAERQALALMDHQSIAKVLDAGTTENGRPFFVMELVHGAPITQYCDDHHLTPKRRLELFLPVCHAVQHAHQKGIIHRDLKPSNMLVCLYDGVPVPKVIDFGVAKATGQSLTERTMFTQFGTLVGTLEYMSPEQAEMSQLGIDTRSDVYSLGVLLYELLTGTTPLQRHRLRDAGFDEIRRLIREEEPPKPSTRLSTSGVALAAISAQRQTEPAKLARLVRGELDWIVMKALEKDRTRRYETANGLARDVERYLHDEPVEACPPTAGYRLHKFARKHQKLLVSAAAFAALLLLGVAGSTWQAVRATQAEEQAVAERDEKEQARRAEAEQRDAAVLNEQLAQQERDTAQLQRDEARALNHQLQRTLYAAHMNLAQHAWEAGGPERVRELLEQHRPKAGESDLRGFEWDYLFRLSHADLLTLKTGGGISVAYSPDGKRLASGGSAREGLVKVWDAQSGQELHALEDAGYDMAFSPDSKRLATTGKSEVKVWDVQTGQLLLKFKKEFDWGLAYSPDGKRLASPGKSEVKVWDAQTGQELLALKGHTERVNSVAFSPDGRRLASASNDKTLRVWDAQTGQELLALKGHTDGLESVVFSPDGKRLASASDDKTVKLWDAQTGQELLSIKGHTGEVRSVAFSPDGKRLASGAEDKTVKVWDAQTGQELGVLKGHNRAVSSTVFSPDGKRLASASYDWTVKVWDVQTDQKPSKFQGAAGSSVASVAFSPDGKRVVSGGKGRPGPRPGEVKVREAQTGQELFTLQGHTAEVTTVAYSPDGKRLASGSGTWDDTKQAYVAGDVRVWDALTGQQLLLLKGPAALIHCVAFSPDGKRLATGGDTLDATKQHIVAGEVKVWDAQTGRELLTLKRSKRSANSVAFSPDGKRLASAGGGLAGSEFKVLDAQTGEELLTCEGNLDLIRSMAFSPDGKRLASAGGWQYPTVRIWDAQTGKELLTCKGHTDAIGSVAFSPDGKRLASADSGGGVKVWDAQTGQELLTLRGHAKEAHGVAFSPDGHRLASGSGDGTVTIWDATPLPEKP
jgi:WD40 repeat protein/serine/threonine protein kinase